MQGAAHAVRGSADDAQGPVHAAQGSAAGAQASLPDAGALQLQGLRSGAGDLPERFGGFDDRNTLMAAERQQMLAIPGDDQVGARRDCGGNDLIVIDIAGHHARHAAGIGSPMAST